MGERGGGGGVGQVVGGDVHRLYGGDGTVLGGGDALLQRAHLAGQRGLVAHGGGHTAQQRGHLAARLHKTEDIVDEQQHVLVLHIAEIFGHGQARQCHAHTDAGGLVHLAEDQRRLVGHAALLHLAPQVVALTAALAHAGEDGIAAVLHGHVVDQLLNEHGLAHAGAAEQTDLAALGVRLDEVDDLDARFQNIGGGHLLGKGGGAAVDLPAGSVGAHRRFAVDGVAQHVEHTAQCGLAYRYGDAVAGGGDGQTPAEAVAAGHHNAAHRLVLQMLLHLHGVARAVCLHGQRLIDGGQAPLREMYVDHGAGNARDGSLFH